MFGKPFRENPKPETPITPELKLPENFTLDNNSPSQPKPFTQKPVEQATSFKTEIDEIETLKVANTVEKISGIVSPYFIAIAGLSLYENNFFLGTILIAVGILSLLKVTAKDVAIFLEWVKEFLGFGNEDEIV